MLDFLNRLYQALPAPLRRWIGILVAAFGYWSASRAFIYAAALAFFTVFSTAPVVIVIVAVIGFVLGEQAVQGELMEQLRDVIGAEAASFIETAVINSQIDQSGMLPTVIGMAAIALGATTVFAQLQHSLNAIWEVAPRPSKSSLWILVKARLLSLTIVLAIGFILLVSLVLSVAVQAVVTFASQWLPVPAKAMVIFELGISLLVISLLFAAIFRILPDVVLTWRDVMLGAVITAILFTIGRWGIALYLANTATSSTYGAAGSLVLLLLWVNYSSLILLYGAAVTRAWVEDRGKTIRPRNTAVRVHRTLIEDPE